jgi:hypothetical protein
LRGVQERDKVGDVIAGSKFIERDITTEESQGEPEAARRLEFAEESVANFLEDVTSLAASLKLIVPAEVAVMRLST